MSRVESSQLRRYKTRMREQQLGDLKVRISGGSDGQGGGDGPVVVLMHGFGAPGTDLVSLAGEIPAPEGTRFVFPEAPLLLPAELGGGMGRAWWMIDVMRLQMAMLTGDVRNMRKEVPEGLADANQLVNGMLDALESELSMDRNKLILGGFSQGGMLATDVVLRSDKPVGGLAVMSGTYLAEDEWSALMPKREDLPVLQSHGRQDPLLPFQLAEDLRDALVGAGLQVTWVPFDGGHGIAPSVLYALSDFVTEATS
jgi:phospholipase/carboxylesterase